MKKQLLILNGVLGAAAAVWLVLGLCGIIGMSRDDMIDRVLEEDRKMRYSASIHIPSDEMAAVLQYSDDREVFQCTIYVNRPGFSFGWFECYRGADERVKDGVLECHVEGLDSVALFSMNRPGVTRIEAEGELSILEEYPADSPFATVLWEGLGDYVMYDEAGNIVEAEKLEVE